MSLEPRQSSLNEGWPIALTTCFSCYLVPFICEFVHTFLFQFVITKHTYEKQIWTEDENWMARTVNFRDLIKWQICRLAVKIIDFRHTYAGRGEACLSPTKIESPFEVELGMVRHHVWFLAHPLQFRYCLQTEVYKLNTLIPQEQIRIHTNPWMVVYHNRQLVS